MGHGRGGTFGVLFGVLLLALSACGTSESSEPSAAGTETSVAVTSAPTSTTAETTVPPSTEPPPPDYEAIYRRLHDEAVAFIQDPLTKPSDALLCAQNVDCIEVTNQALEGQFWQGIGPDNLTITSVEVLDEVSADLVHLKVSAEAEDVIRLVDGDGEVVDQFTLPTGAAKRVVLVRDGGDWALSAVMDGRSWTRQAFEPRDAFSLVDPLDEAMTPTGEEGVTPDGVVWRALTTEDRFCLEAEEPSIGQITRCLSVPAYRDTQATINFTMAFAGDAPNSHYLVLWFGLKADTGIINFEDGGEQIDQLFPIDTSAVFDDVELTIGVSMIDRRPASIGARGPEDQTDLIDLDWPVAKE